LFSPSRKQHNNKDSLATDLFEPLNFEQSFFKTVFQRNSFFQNFIKNNLCKVSRRRARDGDRNPSKPRPRRDLRPSTPRPRLKKTGLDKRLETKTKSRDSITVIYTLKPKHFSEDSDISDESFQSLLKRLADMNHEPFVVEKFGDND